MNQKNNKMKTLLNLFVVVLVFMAFFANAQSLDRTNLTSSGANAYIGNHQYSWSLGEVIVSSQIDHIQLGYQRGTLQLLNNIETVHGKFEVTLYPNPSSSEINWKTKERIKAVEIFTSQGVKVAHKYDNGTSHISVHRLPAGVYFIRLHTSSAMSQQSFIKS